MSMCTTNTQQYIPTCPFGHTQLAHLWSIGNHKVGGINSVDEGASQVHRTSTSVGHLLLSPVCMHACVHQLA